MADIIDDANERAEQFLEEALKRRVPTPTPIGKCHNCGERIEAKQLFCDGECLADYETREKAKQRNGV